MQLSSIQHNTTTGTWSLVMISNETRKIYGIPVDEKIARDIMVREQMTYQISDAGDPVQEYCKFSK